ncbi:hypothetical protein Achl_4290 (plasmid) [Pseudarthrobacter chlorophenolicus A6]|uniref:Uncharacterized protein n=1 Tax=Pseudarthrobacter chlorophenolicus (strain ATCC 700700 / DSM 12829 / CIP 107037 / JCM 12360 / KCTC 9906 / NCIMB 13794 / A6) TaxID=452863 RepID=B8HIJ4_PSECP|nr:hypothetical protein [Pseudarthrobacter chlorophenolicus]ACL42241.1 hypothetical protein Achl_4290 [Pseudarthrobacter chlorophenolicus A6]SDQ15356.1 hypothetical protein SAMN04489738_0348 [Pseudarthrobacter chlorophenolicus]
MTHTSRRGPALLKIWTWVIAAMMCTASALGFAASAAGAADGDKNVIAALLASSVLFIVLGLTLAVAVKSRHSKGSRGRGD